MRIRPWAVGLIFLCLLAALGLFLFWRARTPPTVTQTIQFRDASPEEKERRRQKSQKLVEDVGKVVESVRRKEDKTFRIVATEEDLNTLLQDRLDTSRFPIRDLSIGLQPDNVAVQGTGNYQGIEAVVTLEGDIVIENNQLQYKVNSLKFGGLPAPGKLQSKVETEVSKQLAKFFEKAGGRIETVTVESGRMIVEGRTK